MKKAQKFWDNQAKRFDDNDKQFEPANLELIARVKKYLKPDDRVLDFGCATGAKTLAFAESVKSITGLDFSSEMIKEAIRKKDDQEVKNADFSQGTIYISDFQSGSFDKVVALSIIHLLPDSETVIRKIHDLLKPGGLLIAETACFREKMDLKTRVTVTFFLFMKRIGILPLHLNMLSVPVLEELICINKFKLVFSDRLFYNGMTISFIVAEKS